MDDGITSMELAIVAMFGTFIKYKGENGKLTKGAFLKMLNEELPFFQQGGAEQREEIFKCMDVNNDGSMDFKEFAMLVATYAVSNYEILQKVMKEAENKK